MGQLAAGSGSGQQDYPRALLALLLVVALFVGLVHFPVDDGLRHVGVAFGEPRPWGEVYPHSVFAEHPRYDPWWGYDQFLRGCAAALRLAGLPDEVARTALVKALSLGFLVTFLLLAVRRAGLAAKVRSPATLAAAGALIALFLSVPLARVLTVRPFVLGSVYLLFVLPGGGFLRAAAAAGLLAVAYPYLFWIYTLPVAVAHLWRGDRRFGAGTLALTAVAVAVQPRDFWGLMQALARSEEIRAALTIKITEFSPLVAEPLLGGAVLLALVCLLPFLPAASRRMGVPHLLMVFFAPAAVRYVRYLIDVEMVLLFVICGASLIEPVAARLALIGRFWAERLRALGARLGRGRPVAKSPAGDGANLRPAIAATALALLAVLGIAVSTRHRDDAALARTLQAVPKGGLVVTHFNLQYRLLFVRPDLRLVPSCELGFPTEAILPEYRRFFDKGDPCGLVRAIGAEWFVGPELMPLDPGSAGCLIHKAAVAPGDSLQGIALWRTGPG